MFRIIWVIDYVGDGVFSANLHPSSSFKEEFMIVKSANRDLGKLQKELENISYVIINGSDHYGKIWEQTEVSFEFTEQCISYLDGIIITNRGKSCLVGLFAIVGLAWLVKILICWIWPMIKPMLLCFMLPLIHNIIL